MTLIGDRMKLESECGTPGYRCPFCDKIETENEYCAHVFDEKGTYCLPQENHTSIFVYRPSNYKSDIDHIQSRMNKNWENSIKELADNHESFLEILKAEIGKLSETK